MILQWLLQALLKIEEPYLRKWGLGVGDFHKGNKHSFLVAFVYEQP